MCVCVLGVCWTDGETLFPNDPSGVSDLVNKARTVSSSGRMSHVFVIIKSAA